MTMFTQRKVQSSPTRRPILIVDDHPLVRRGLKTLIDAEHDLIVCAKLLPERTVYVRSPQRGPIWWSSSLRSSAATAFS